MNTDLIKRQTIESMCNAYQEANKEVQEAFRLMFSAIERLKIFDSTYPSILPRSMSTTPSERDAQESEKIIKKDCWRAVLRHTQIEQWCSVKQANEFQQQLENGTLPELTVANVFGLVEKLSNNLESMFEEAIKEVFDFLRPGQWCHHKTNNKFEVGKKVIIDWGIDTSYGMMRPVYRKEQSYRALDNIFHLLDGKGVSKYPSDFVTALNGACHKKEWECETEYFKCKWYKRGTLHIEFKRLDLVKELNRRAGGMNFSGKIAC